MISDLLEKVVQVWQRLSMREQRLAVITALVVALMAVFWGYTSAIGRIDTLDREISRLEEQLVSYTGLLAHRSVIESQYAAIAAQHSSEWTEAEIHDRLRQEIYRLAQNVPPSLNAQGIPVSLAGNVGNIVDIPSLGKGMMAEGGQGYREYRINLRIPNTNLYSLIEFLQRLHNSPQSLRIDALELNRSPESEAIAASIDISRIVADGAPKTAAPAQPLESGVGRVHLNAQAWQARDARVVDSDEGAQSPYGAVDIHLVGAAAEIYLPHTLPGGKSYEMVVNAASTTQNAAIGVALEANGMPLASSQPLKGDGEVHRYQLQFSVPEGGAPVQLRSPWIQGNEPNAVVRIMGLLLRDASEMYQ